MEQEPAMPGGHGPLSPAGWIFAIGCKPDISPFHFLWVMTKFKGLLILKSIVPICSQTMERIELWNVPETTEQSCFIQ